MLGVRVGLGFDPTGVGVDFSEKERKRKKKKRFEAEEWANDRSIPVGLFLED